MKPIFRVLENDSFFQSDDQFLIECVLKYPEYEVFQIIPSTNSFFGGTVFKVILKLKTI